MKEFIDRLRRILDEMEISHRVTNGKGYPEIVFTLSKDENCSDNVIIVIGINEGLMVLKGYLDEYVIEKSKIPDAILFCNKWNGSKLLPQVFASESGEIVSTWCFALPDEFSDEYLKEHLLLAFSKMTWKFFCEFLEEIE